MHIDEKTIKQALLCYGLPSSMRQGRVGDEKDVKCTIPQTMKTL